MQPERIVLFGLVIGETVRCLRRGGNDESGHHAEYGERMFLAVRVRLFTGIFNNKRELAPVLSDNSGPILPVGGGWPQFVCIKTAAPWLSETATKRTQPMTRKFIAAVVGAALAITAVGSSPVRADQDLVRALAVIAGIAIVGKVIEDRIEDNDNRVSRNRYDDRYYDVRPGYH